ncbi:VENN motif pre-toxin domain-containing protein [Snodgrassella communis]|uniref:VENN motif pre-toxin domain-containing protein n=1 Tax=Snodgrassella communis TaxID=2946699 RepID=UPI001EF61155|nr:VENN motif pre-toxin domain-containing protein [Snodgrassella communis]
MQATSAFINSKKDKLKEELKQENLSPEQRAQYEKELAQWNSGGLILNAIGAGLSAPTNSIGGILAATASPVLSHQIGQYFKGKDAEGSTAHLVAHAVLGAAVAAAGGNDALAGGLAAAGAEATAPILSQWLYGKNPADLTADEKATVSAIAGLTGAATEVAVGGSMADMAQGNQAGHTAVDNNQLAWKLTQKVQEQEMVDFFHENLGKKVKLQPKLDKDGNPIKTKDGYEILDLVIVGDINQFTEKEKEVYKELKNIIDDPNNIAKVTIDKDVPMVNTGDYINQIIDLVDIYEYDKNPYGMSGIAAMMHELVEQYEKSKRGTAIGSAGYWDKSKGSPEQDPKSDFNNDHSEAIKAQNKIDNTDRTQGNIMDNNSGKQYIMFYIDKTNNKVTGITEQKKVINIRHKKQN